jgi:hypothetical protein
MLQDRLDATAQHCAKLQETCNVLNVGVAELRNRVEKLESENLDLRMRVAAER